MVLNLEFVILMSGKGMEMENTFLANNDENLASSSEVQILGGASKQKLLFLLYRTDKSELQQSMSGEEAEASKLVKHDPASTKVSTERFDLLLERGSPDLKKTVFNWLETCFDCTVSKHSLYISPQHLSSVAYALTEASIKEYGPIGVPNSKDGTEYGRDEPYPLEFAFELPETVRKAGLNEIVLGLDEPGLQTIHLALEKSSAVEQEDFLDILVEYFTRYSNINLKGTRLKKLVTPALALDSSGQIRISEEGVFPTILSEMARISSSLSLESGQ